MAKILTPEELEELRLEGAEISLEKREIQLDGLQDLAEQFKRIAVANEAMAKQSNKDLKQSIDKLTQAVIQKDFTSSEMVAILKQLTAMQTQANVTPERPEYQFDIKRNSRNLMTQVVAKPVINKVH